jgi:hypothetical protein
MNLMEDSGSPSGFATRLPGLLGQITVDHYNFVLDEAMVFESDVDRASAIIVVGDTDLGILDYGVPWGYEVASLVDAVRCEFGLSDKSLAPVAALDRPVDMRVFVTPTWIYRLQAVSLACRLTAASSGMKVVAVDATEFSELARHRRVSGVPKTVIDGTETFGAEPEDVLARRILEGAAEGPVA